MEENMKELFDKLMKDVSDSIDLSKSLKSIFRNYPTAENKQKLEEADIDLKAKQDALEDFMRKHNYIRRLQGKDKSNARY